MSSEIHALDPARERALTLAQEAENRVWTPTAEIIKRARDYLDFLRGTKDARLIALAQEVHQKFSSALSDREPS
jgi:hypothetical protein